MRRFIRPFLTAALFALAAGCTGGPATPSEGEGEGEGELSCACEVGQTRCVGTVIETCAAIDDVDCAAFTPGTDCAETTQRCEQGADGAVCAGVRNGGKCVEGSECGGGICLTEDATAIPGGLCMSLCGLGVGCSPTEICLSLGEASACIARCDINDPTTCSGRCDDTGTDGVCIPTCTTDAECTAPNTCRDGACYPPEDCATPGDENGDGNADCADSACTEVCAEATNAQCATAVSLAEGTITGDTTGAAAVLVSSCAGQGPEQLYTLAPALGGLAVVRLTSSADLGLHARSTCADTTSELACSDLLYDDPATERLVFALDTGFGATVVVDGFNEDEAGSYTLAYTRLTPGVETEPNAQDNANDVAGSGVMAGAVGTAGDLDRFRFTLAELSDVTISTHAPAGASCDATHDSQLFLSTSEAAFGGNDDAVGSCAEFSIQLDPGDYFVDVRAGELCPDCLFDYLLFVDARPAGT